MKSDYPSECFRGIASEKFVDNGLPCANLFSNFDKPNKTLREDGFDELSVTWNDEESSLSLMWKQINRNGEIQFKYGVAVLRKSDLNILKSDPRFKGIFDYERKATANNKFHGNLLIRSDIDSPKRKMLYSLLAFYANQVIIRPT